MDLTHHGDREVGPGLADFAVNVYDGPRPAWLDEAIRASLDRVHRYPDPAAARHAIAALHHRAVDEALPTSGGAEAFTLIARARDWRHPVVVHPQFTEPEAALLAAGRPVERVLLDCDFVLDPAVIPRSADLVMLGNPTNPTGVLHSRDTIEPLLKDGRVVVVDEAFMDVVPDQRHALADARRDGLVVIRSLTKTWAIPGLRAGYVVGDAAVVADLERQQPPWSVSTPSLAALETVASSGSPDEAVTALATWRTHLLATLPLEVVGAPVTPFVLARCPAGLHGALRELGFAVRRCDTFPGLDDSYVRIAVRPPEQTDALVTAIEKALG